MSMFKRSVIFAGAIALTVFSFNAVQAQNKFVILGKVDKHYKALQSLQANIKLEKVDSVLGERDVSEGTITMLPKTEKRDLYVRIDWAKPRVENISIIGNSYMIYRPKANQVIKGTRGKSVKSVPTGSLDFLSMSQAQLKANYEIDVAGEESIEGGTKASHLILTPKAKGNYKSAEIWVDEHGMINLARVNDHNGDTTTVLLSKIVKNGTVQASIFKINYPKDAKVVNS